MVANWISMWHPVSHRLWCSNHAPTYARSKQVYEQSALIIHLQLTYFILPWNSMCHCFIGTTGVNLMPLTVKLSRFFCSSAVRYRHVSGNCGKTNICSLNSGTRSITNVLDNPLLRIAVANTTNCLSLAVDVLK